MELARGLALSVPILVMLTLGATRQGMLWGVELTGPGGDTFSPSMGNGRVRFNLLLELSHEVTLGFRRLPLRFPEEANLSSS